VAEYPSSASAGSAPIYRSVWLNIEGKRISDDMGPAEYAAQRGSVANPNYFD